MNLISDLIENTYNVLQTYYSVKKEKSGLQGAFRIDRLIDVAGHNKQAIYVGVVSSGDQAIRVGELGQPIYKLVQFAKMSGSLKYEFENAICLSFIRDNDNTIKYTLKSPQFQQQDYFHGQYKTINMSSQDLDEIAWLQSNRTILG